MPTAEELVGLAVEILGGPRRGETGRVVGVRNEFRHVERTGLVFGGPTGRHVARGPTWLVVEFCDAERVELLPHEVRVLRR